MYKYEEVIQDLHEKLIHGIWKEGQSLPSIRQLAEQYQCSKSTIIRAYTELERQHLIYSIPQSGYYVVKHENQQLQNPNPIIDFASASPDRDLFPYRDFQHCLNQAIDRYQNELFLYGIPQGLPSLIDVLQKQLADHQVFAHSEQFAITSGVQQALSILTMMPFPNKKETILIEQPSYHLFIQMLELLQKPVIGIRRTRDGLDLNLLEQLFRTEQIKFFYTMPRFQNPLGTSLHQKEKKSIAELAKRYDVYIVEDDYLLDLEMDTKADPIYSSQNGHIIYLKSFSKVIFPGLRVGVTILPTELISLFRHYKKTQDIDSSMLSQAGLEIYIKNGMYNYHLKKIRSSYSKRMQIMYETLISMNMEEYITFPPIQTGTHTHLLLKRPVSIEKLRQIMQQHRIIISSSEKYYLHHHSKDHLLQVKISNVPSEKINFGLTTLLLAVKKLSDLNARQFF
ncbi:PLP-dependent aminotransferase family protein [Shimazuella sp. AN120528]|uniref:aminotransferase-like domain-containing protein n=1 Tax=Shimazuella soli TaxID=1892854 RepID=UPI001F101D0D|nr:PLP-dependent aminotransferase family protein [Shimazuella soli]MCH5584562.1 PLP-dependent aminotransferase family protein [Shimazuella soli]